MLAVIISWQEVAVIAIGNAGVLGGLWIGTRAWRK